MRERRIELALLGLLFAVALGQRIWNAYFVPPLTGYDSPGHAGYMLTILEERRLPHPYDGWSTFHPPLYYLLGAAVWGVAEPFGPRTLVAAVRSIGALAGLLAALCAWRAVRLLGHGAAVAWVACALALFVPVAQLAGVMIGNEALVAGLASGGFLLSLSLQRAPGSMRSAGLLGACVGLALATKYTGEFALPALVWPFLCAAARRERGAWPRAAALALALCLGLGAPVYLRNILVTGEVLPMTRALEPMRSAEASLVLRPRRVGDYFTMPWNALRRPSLYHEAGRLGSFRNRNASMTSVPALFYASVWFDPFGHRTSVRDHRDGVWFGPALTLAGLVPSLLVLIGFVRCLARAVRTRGSALEAPLTVSAVLALATFVWITWTAPSAAAVKASYLLPLLVPAAVFFAEGTTVLARPLRALALALSLASATLAALVFTANLLHPSLAMGLRTWLLFADQLPRSHIRPAIERMLIGW